MTVKQALVERGTFCPYNKVMTYWLMKTEPDTFSISDLENSLGQTSPWEGVRNYQARNFMLEMECGDQAFIYHSSCKHIGIAGLATVTRKAYPDPTCLDANSKYFDPKSTPERPRWFMVDVTFKEKFPSILGLKTIKDHPLISQIPLVNKGSRLSIMPIIEAEFELLLEMARN